MGADVESSFDGEGVGKSENDDDDEEILEILNGKHNLAGLDLDGNKTAASELAESTDDGWVVMTY